MGVRKTPWRMSVLGLAAMTAVAGGAVVMASPVAADTHPRAPELPVTVSGAVLPAPQIDGVAWTTVIAGNTVFVGGDFTKSWPFGKAEGTLESPRGGLLAFDLATGKLLPMDLPVNGEVRHLSLSPDGKTLYVTGTFTTVGGQPRYRFAAIDVARGQLTDLTVTLDSTTHTSMQHGNTIYIGGAFSMANGQPRGRLAAINATTGELLPWAPSADMAVRDLAISPTGATVVAAGNFTRLAGVPAAGWGAIHGSTGAALEWPANNTIKTGEVNAAIFDLDQDASGVYAVGYSYDPKYRFEGTVKTGWDGNLHWVKGCKGDSYGVSVGHDVVYAAHHNHNCEPVGGIPDRQPWIHQRADATTSGKSPFGRTNSSGDYAGHLAPELLHWWPEFVAGETTGMNQAAWAVDATNTHVVLVGEFPWVNWTKQSGIVVFAKESVANKSAPPRGGHKELNPQSSVERGKVTVSFDGVYDPDSHSLTYELWRDGTKVASTVIEGNTWWNAQGGSVVDVVAPNGEHTYVLKVVDKSGNSVQSDAMKIMVRDAPATTRFVGEVRADSPTHYWSFNERAGAVGFDDTEKNNLDLGPDSTRLGDGAINEERNRSVTFTGKNLRGAATSRWENGPSEFALEAWFKTTTQDGGAILNFGTSQVAASRARDKVLYMSDGGRLHFVVWSGGVKHLHTTTPLNDGQWHHVVANASAAGMELFVDGQRVAHLPDSVTTDSYKGFWRIAGDSLVGMPEKPTSFGFAGSLDDVAVYDKPLPAERIEARYRYKK